MTVGRDFCDPMKTLFATSAPAYAAPLPLLDPSQLRCGPHQWDSEIGEHIFARRTPRGDYSLGDFCAELPWSVAPDATVVVIDGDVTALPRNVKQCPGPRILWLGELPTGGEALNRLKAYVRTEGFDAAVLTAGPNGATVLDHAEAPPVLLRPGWLSPLRDADLPIIRESEREAVLLSEIPRWTVHSQFNETLSRLIEQKVEPIFVGIDDEERLEEWGRARVGLIEASTGDLPPMAWEAIAAGTALIAVTQPGVETMDDLPVCWVSDVESGVEKVQEFLRDPAVAAAQGARAAAWYDAHLSLAQRSQAWPEIVATLQQGNSLGDLSEGGANPPLSAPMEDDFTRTGRLIDSGQWEDAATAVKLLLESHPKSAIPHLMMADLAAESGQQNVFEQFLSQAEKQDAYDPRLRWLRDRLARGEARLGYRMVRHAWALWHQGEDDEALRIARDLAERASLTIEAHLLVAHASTRKDYHEAANEALARACRLDPNRDQRWFEHGLDAWAAGDRETGGFALRRAADHEPENAQYGIAWNEAQRLDPTQESHPDQKRDVLIMGSETNQRHGAGVLVKRYFGRAPEMVSIRPASPYDGVEEVGGTHLLVLPGDLSPVRLRTRLRRLLRPYQVRRLFAVPQNPPEWVTARLLQDISGAPLCTYVMDDRNVYHRGVPDDMATALFDRSGLLLTISPEMQLTYGIKFGRSFGMMPPIVSTSAARRKNSWNRKKRNSLRGALVGNVWSDRQFTQLKAFMQRTGLELDWFGRPADSKCEAFGLHGQGFLPEDELADRLTEYPFAVVTSGSLDGTEDDEWLTRLSLPSRMVFLLQTQVPVLVLGSPDTAAGGLVTRIGNGEVLPYSHPDPLKVIRRLTNGDSRRCYLDAAERWADAFTMPDSGSWLWESLAVGRVLPAPFHALMKPESTLRVLRGDEAA